jgi:hypothetical protein
VQIVRLIALIWSVFEVEVHVIDVAQYDTSLFLAESSMTARLVGMVNAFYKRVVAG